jgi:hypothetical protein
MVASSFASLAVTGVVLMLVENMANALSMSDFESNH